MTESTKINKQKFENRQYRYSRVQYFTTQSIYFFIYLYKCEHLRTSIENTFESKYSHDNDITLNEVNENALRIKNDKVLSQHVTFKINLWSKIVNYKCVFVWHTVIKNVYNVDKDKKERQRKSCID